MKIVISAIAIQHVQIIEAASKSRGGLDDLWQACVGPEDD
jgi:hypothetical protein